MVITAIKMIKLFELTQNVDGNRLSILIYDTLICQLKTLKMLTSQYS